MLRVAPENRISRFFTMLILLWSWISLTPGAIAAGDVLDVVDPLIGTAGGGHVFPGATLPFGMAKASADVDFENQGGFSTDQVNNVTGFSHMHDSGTGGSPSLGNFPLWPQAACKGDNIDGCAYSKFHRGKKYFKNSLVAEPGYFALTLNTSIMAEMTVTNHTALYRFTFPSTSPVKGAPSSPLILADLTDLPNSRSNASAKVDPDTGRITGSGVFNPSFGIGTYTLHFCSDFQGAPIRDTGVFINNRAGTQPKQIKVYPDGVDSEDATIPAGAWVRFHQPKSKVIFARVGLSFISSNQACKNAENEISNFAFDKTRKAAKQAWREKLEVVSIKPGKVGKGIQTSFWSGIYRTMISPQDYTGENPLWKSTEPYYDSYYCIWDSFRSIHPLITLLDPLSQSRMVRSLVDIWRHESWLPDCRMSLDKGFTQGGSNADIVLADAYLKNISNVNWGDAYKAVLQDAEVEPPVWSIEGRGGLHSWKSYHYIPTDDFDPYGSGPLTRSISRTVEYAYDDFCVAEMAKGLGKMNDYEKYTKRSRNWHNMFNQHSKSEGYSGFLQPRYMNGTFGIQDPTLGAPKNNQDCCFLNPTGKETYEGSSWLYTWFVPGDMASLIVALGGPDTFVDRLNHFHTANLLYVGDEQSFLTIYLYHYVGRPGLSAMRSHTYIPSMFNTTFNGLPGNDDSGAMGSFEALSMIGLFPNPGQNVYLITPPYFKSVSILNQQTGKTATIKNINFDPEYNAIYIQSAKLNGKKYTKNWIDHKFFLHGGTLELTLGKNESTWGTKDKDLPPSLSTTGVHLFS